jgi:hypothetical protein
MFTFLSGGYLRLESATVKAPRKSRKRSRKR